MADFVEVKLHCARGRNRSKQREREEGRGRRKTERWTERWMESGTKRRKSMERGGYIYIL